MATLPALVPAINDGQRFLVEVNTVFGGANPQQDVSGVELSLPLPALNLAQHSRFETAIHGNNINCIRRSAFDTLYTTLNTNHFSYLNGPIGMGKPFALSTSTVDSAPLQTLVSSTSTAVLHYVVLVATTTSSKQQQQHLQTTRFALRKLMLVPSMACGIPC